MIIVWVHSNQIKESQKFSSHLNKTLRNKEPKSRSSIISLILFFLTYFYYLLCYRLYDYYFDVNTCLFILGYMKNVLVDEALHAGR